MLLHRLTSRRRATLQDTTGRVDRRPPAPPRVRRHREPVPRMRWYA